MKEYINPMKKYTKKALSVFMAALMLLTCWVFVAPEQAEAVNGGTNYSYVITGTYRGTGDNDTINSISASLNGASTISFSPSNLSANFGEGTWKLEFTSTNLITSGPVTINANLNTTSGEKTTNFYFGSFTINGRTISGASAGGFSLTSDDACNSASNKTAYVSFSCPAEAVAEVVIDSQPGNVTVPKTGTAPTTIKSHAVNQYGKVMASSKAGEPTVTIKNTATNAAITGVSGSYTSTNSTSDTSTVSVTNSAKMTGTTDSITAQASVKYGNITKTTNNFTITDVSYTQVFNGNDGTITPNTTLTNYYGHTITSSTPTGNRTGYDFLGLYPTDYPDSYAATKPNYSGKLTTSTTISEDTTWFGAWWAKNAKVTFVDYDGTVLSSTEVAKYNQGATLFKPAVDPTYAQPFGQTGSFIYSFEGWYVYDAKQYDSTGAQVYYNVEGAPLNGFTVKGDTVFMARYTPTQNNYTVNFYDDGVTLSSRNDYHYRDPIAQPEERTENQWLRQDDTYEYYFKGWTVIPDNSPTTRFYVDEEGFTDDDVYIPINTDFEVRSDVSFAAVVEKRYRNYTMRFNYDGVQNKTVYTNVHYGDTVEVPTPAASYTFNGRRYVFNGEWYLNQAGTGEPVDPSTCIGNKNYYAKYISEPAIYEIQFYDYDGTPLLPEGSTSFAHGEQVLYNGQPAEDYAYANITQVYRDDYYEYEFFGWSQLFNSTAEADVDYIAQYTAIPLYTVNYYNGDELLESVKEVATRAVPGYTGETPVKPADAYALDGYTFTGWKDADNNTVSVMPEADVNLYAQYSCDPTEYTVNFIRDDGSVISTATYHYGDTVTEPAEAACAKPSDNTFSYEYIGWDHTPSEECEGNATYTARYRKNYIYYPVVWEEEDGSELDSSSFIYNEILNPPYDVPGTSQTPSDQDYVFAFAGWKYKDDNSPFVRGDRMLADHIIDGETRLVPVFVEVPRVCTVNLYKEDGTTLWQTINVGVDTAVDDLPYSTPVKTATADKHYVFDGWVNMDGSAWAGVVEDDISLKASFVEEDHNYQVIRVDIYPTFDAEGEATERCSCGLDRPEQVIPALTDGIDPTSKIYVGSSSWTESQATNNAPIATAPNNIVIINGDDKAEAVQIYNVDGEGSGVRYIQLYVATEGNLPASPEAIDESDWFTCFDNDDALAHGVVLSEANATFFLGDGIEAFFGDELATGTNYVIYGRLVDYKDNASYINTPLLKYDDEAPEVTVTSDCSSGSKHCIDATITVASDDTARVLLDGAEITLTDGAYTVDVAGQHQVEVRDLAGNSTKVNFQIIGSHNTRTYTVDSTCTEVGYTIEKCQLCNSEVGERVETPALGHNYVAKVVPATCLEDGYTKYTCSRCGDTYIDNIVEATGDHTWVDGAVISEATCSHEGLKRMVCSECGETKTETISIDENAHVYYRPVLVRPSCTEEGRVEKTCKYCGFVVVTETIPAADHVPSGKWVVIQPANCTETGTKGQYCKNCDHEEPLVTETIPARGHRLVIDHVVAPTATEQGYTVYRCTRCDYTENGNYVDLTTYDVTFLGEDGTTPIDTFAVPTGEVLTADDIPVPVKASTETYRYIFAGWVDAATEVAVTFPLTVTSDVTLKATFTERFVNYTIIFQKDDGTEFDRVGYKHYGETVTKAGPVKPGDASNDYTFLGWVPADDPDAEPITNITVTGNLTFKAKYGATAKTYTVTWRIAGESTYLHMEQNVPGGSSVSYPSTAPVPTKASNTAQGHYVFSGWDKETTNVTSNLVVTAQFAVVAHSYTTSTTPADCDHPATTTHTCSVCGYSYTTTSGSALEHQWVTTHRVPSTLTVAGYEDQRCDRCGETRTVNLPLLSIIRITVEVKDQKGRAVSGVLVKLFDGNTLVSSARTNGDGRVVFEVTEAKQYRIEIEGAGSSNITVNPDGTISGTIPTVYVQDPCSCTCHRDGLWPSIFRFFHKVIKMLVGEFVCCGNPDARYGA